MAQTVEPQHPEPARQFGWSNHFIHPDDDPRTDGHFDGERDTLMGFLRDQRLTLELKCADLDAGDMARPAVAPSNLSLLGLVRHMAKVEQIWFRIRLAREDVEPHYVTTEDPDGDFTGAVADPAVVADAWTTWRTEIEFADRFVGETPDLAFVAQNGHTLRAILVHMIEEYARHNGHADFLRERLDGRIGQ